MVLNRLLSRQSSSTHRRIAMNVLSLDDHYEDIAPLLKAFFAGDSLCFTKTPAEARRKLEQQKFDLVVLDGDLGAGGSGPDVLRSWKARDMVLPPVVMFSADASML